jgi:hypothetical protein
MILTERIKKLKYVITDVHGNECFFEADQTEKIIIEGLKNPEGNNIVLNHHFAALEGYWLKDNSLTMKQL